MTRPLIISVLLAVWAVSAGSCSPMKPAEPTNETTSRSGTSPYNLSRSQAELVGRPFDEVLAIYTPPTSDLVITIDKGSRLNELQGGLYKVVLDTLSAGASADVRQATWTGDDQPQERRIWGARREGVWVVVDALEWDKGVRF